jgi:hypothetical protein
VKTAALSPGSPESHRLQAEEGTEGPCGQFSGFKWKQELCVMEVGRGGMLEPSLDKREYFRGGGRGRGRHCRLRRYQNCAMKEDVHCVTWCVDHPGLTIKSPTA